MKYVTCASLLVASVLGAQESEDVLTLAPVAVNGEVYAFGAQKIVYVTDEDLEELQAIDLNDIFQQDPSIQVGGGLPAAQKIYIRGIEDKMLNITVDGATQGGYLNHHQGQYIIEPELLKYVETEPGPGGAIQGPGALAGSIRFETKGPYDFLDVGQRFGAFNKVSYLSNADAYKWTTAAYGEVSDGIGVLGSFTYYDTDNYEDGRGNEVDYTAHTQKRGFLKTVAEIADGQEITLGLERVQDEGVYRHRPNFSGYFPHPVAPNVPVPMEFTRDTVTLSYDQSPQDTANGLEVTTFYTDNNVDRAAQYEMGYESLGLDVRNKTELGDHKLTYGADARLDTLSFTGKGSTTGASPLVYQTIPDEDLVVLGAYAQDDWSVSERLEASFGARVDYYDYEDHYGMTFEDAGISPNVGLSYRLIEGLRVNGSYGFAFRGVSIIDAITSNEGSVNNDPDLDPERAQNVEFGFQYNKGIFTASGTVYRQTIDDVISNGGGTRTNIGELEVEGYDLSAGIKVNGFEGSLAVSYADPELNGVNLTDVDFGLGTSYARNWSANLGYLFEELRLRVGWSAIYFEEYDEGGTVPKPSYDVHNVHVQWFPFENEDLRITLAVLNLFDEYYVDQATAGYNGRLGRVAGLPAAGRDFRIAASYQF